MQRPVLRKVGEGEKRSGMGQNGGVCVFLLAEEGKDSPQYSWNAGATRRGGIFCRSPFGLTIPP